MTMQTPTAGLSLTGLPNLDALFMAGRHLPIDHVCSALCNDIFHTDPRDQKHWPDLEPTVGRLYHQYAAVYEHTHPGQFVAIVATGRAVVAATLRDVVVAAIAACPHEADIVAGFSIFRIGQRSVRIDAAEPTAV